MILYDPDRLARLLRAAGIDILIATKPEHVRYLVDLPDDLATALGLQIAVVARAHPFEVTTIVAPRGIAGVLPDELVAGTDIWLYGRFYGLVDPDAELRTEERRISGLLASAPGEDDTFASALEDVLRRLPASSRLAWDDASIDGIARDAGHGPAADGAAVLRSVRQVKTPAETERLQRAADVAEAVERTIFDASVVGADWADIAEMVPGAVASRGGRFGFLTGGAGWQAGFVFKPRPLALKAGQLVRLDLGLSVDGYWTDTGRSAAIGQPTDETLARYRAIRAGADAALALARPGGTFGAMYDAAMAVIRIAVNGYQRHHCGHAIGLRAYDGPLVGPGDDTVLETGMVLNVEVPLYVIGWGGLQLEDTIVIESDGFRSLTRLDRDLLILPA